MLTRGIAEAAILVLIRSYLSDNLTLEQAYARSLSQSLDFWCAGETGKELVVQVHYGEGVAIRIGPEPCVGTREGDGEASTGERIGQPLSRVNKIVPGADVFRITEGNTDRCVIASICPTRRGRRPWHVRKLFAREPGGLGFGRRVDTAGPHREDEES